MLRAGTLNRRIRIQQRIAGQSESGAPVDQWADLAEVSANVRYLSGSESIKSDAPVSVAKASVRIRYRTDVVANMRVLCGPTVLDVRAVLPNEETREYVDLVCETGANDG